MTDDPNVVFVSRGSVVARVTPFAPFFRGAAALVDGDATRERPQHFVMLACHSDLADEAPAVITEQLTTELAREVLALLQRHPDITEFFRASNPVAAATGRYYSIMAGRITERKVVMGATGSVAATVVTSNSRTSVVTPNMVRIGEHRILNNAFGIGFKEEELSIKELYLDDAAKLLLVISKDSVTGLVTNHQNAADIITDAVHSARTAPPIVAVLC